MNFDYQQNDIAAGMVKRGMAEETPNIFAERQGAAQVSPSTHLDMASQRMAGPVGARALALASNPEEQKRTSMWMQQFGLSNQGMEFNQAKMMQMAPPAPAQEEPQQ